VKKLSFASNALIVLCGPAGSGKSSFAKKFFHPTQIVSSDECRNLIADDPGNQRVSPDAFDLMHAIIAARLKYNRLTVADATHLSIIYRRPLIELAQKFQCPLYLVLFNADEATCLKNNALRPRQVESVVITRHLEQFRQTHEQIKTEPYRAVYTIEPTDIENLTIELIPPSSL